MALATVEWRNVRKESLFPCFAFAKAKFQFCVSLQATFYNDVATHAENHFGAPAF